LPYICPLLIAPLRHMPPHFTFRRYAAIAFALSLRRCLLFRLFFAFAADTPHFHYASMPLMPPAARHFSPLTLSLMPPRHFRHTLMPFSLFFAAAMLMMILKLLLLLMLFTPCHFADFRRFCSFRLIHYAAGHYFIFHFPPAARFSFDADGHAAAAFADMLSMPFR